MHYYQKNIKGAFFRICFSALFIILLQRTAYCQTETVIAFGDSLTEGCDVQYPSASECGWVEGYGYENELRALLATNGWDVAVYNYGSGGESTAEGVNRLDSVLNADCNKDAKYILIMEGTNDLLHFKGWEYVLFNLDIMIDKCRAAGIIPLLATLTPDPDHEYKDIPLMNEKIREYAASKVPRVILVDQYNALAADWPVYTDPRGCYGDLLHPNEEGFDAMGSVWYAALSKFFKRSFPWMSLLLDTPHRPD